jgi:hypothetical protein
LREAAYADIKGLRVGIGFGSRLVYSDVSVSRLSEVSSTRTRGRGVLLNYLVSIITSPSFWIMAVVLFCAVVFFTGRRALVHP